MMKKEIGEWGKLSQIDQLFLNGNALKMFFIKKVWWVNTDNDLRFSSEVGQRFLQHVILFPKTPIPGSTKALPVYIFKFFYHELGKVFVVYILERIKGFFFFLL